MLPVASEAEAEAALLAPSAPSFFLELNMSLLGTSSGSV